MSAIDEAIALAVITHKDQLDKAGQPYILHPIRLMLRFESEAERIVAVMHDVIEDGDLSLSDLDSRGFSAEVIEAIDCLTRKEGESYQDFIQRASKNPLSRKVKIEDIKDNLNITRLVSITDKDLQRIRKYHEALVFLSREQEAGQI